MSTALVSLCTAAALVTSPAAPLVHGSAPLPTISLGAAQPADAPPPSEAAPAPAPAETAPAAAPAPAEPAVADPAAATQPPAADPAAATQPPPPTINVTVEPAPAPEPPPPQPAEPEVTAGRGLLITGGVTMGVGGASLLFVALPSLFIRNAALDRAEREDVLAFSSRETRYNRARRADDAMEAGFWIGAPMLLAGTAILIVGSVVRNSARNRQNRRMRAAAAPGGVAVHF